MVSSKMCRDLGMARLQILLYLDVAWINSSETSFRSRFVEGKCCLIGISRISYSGCEIWFEVSWDSYK